MSDKEKVSRTGSVLKWFVLQLEHMKVSVTCMQGDYMVVTFLYLYCTGLLHMYTSYIPFQGIPVSLLAGV